MEKNSALSEPNAPSLSPDRARRLESQLQDVLEIICATETFVNGLDFWSFGRDQKTIFATERALGIISATAKRLPINFMDQHPQINWRRIIGFGDSLTFGYLEVDLNILWTLIQTDLPQLKGLLEQMLKESF
ncbi:MAG: HepT-like ribonuclease domain-containing protein [Pseudanabaena sp. ELA607]